MAALPATAPGMEPEGITTMRRSALAKLMSSSTLGVGAFVSLAVAAPAWAQDPVEARPAEPPSIAEVVVTGSRIRKSSVDTTAPVTTVTQQDFDDRGFVQAGQALNQLTTITPSFPETSGLGVASGNGQNFPNLFNLGPGRTLTLVDGRRFVSSSSPVTGTASGAGSAVDTNLIPVGLLERVEVVEAGGAAVYGSDAIAGVVNYVLKKNFKGVEMDAQYGVTDRGDYNQYNARLTAGTDFLGGKGGVAADFEYSKTDPLRYSDRNLPALARSTSGVVPILNSRFYAFNNNGVIFTTPAPTAICSGANCFAKLNGQPLQFAADGASVIAYNPGVNPVTGSTTAFTPPFASGGDGFNTGDLAALYSGVERFVGNLVAHYDVSDHLKLSASFLGAHTTGTDLAGSQGYSRTVLNTPASGSGYITFTRANPFLTAADLATLSAAAPSFAAGAPLFLSKQFADILPTRTFTTDTDTYRGLFAADGDFNLFGRNYYYSASYSRSETLSNQLGYAVNNARVTNALNATRNAAGDIVCSINATVVSDPGCVAINPFGTNNIPIGGKYYTSSEVGYHYLNQQDDFLATLGGSVIRLPAGESKFSVAYEHREENAKFVPARALQLGLTGSGVPSVPSGGRYETDEYSGELLIPVFGGDFTLPGFKALELNGQFRRVDNSIAGSEDVWGAGVRWQPIDGVTLRYSRSRNFRAPTLYQLFAPSSTALAGGVQDPCDNRYINTGSTPAVRQANCLALFQANALYGTGTSAVGASAATRLANFQNTSTNFSTALVTSGGNSTLANEVSDTSTFGFVLQPKWVPGQFTLTLDHVSVEILNGLTGFTPTNFSQSCFDVAEANGPTCAFFTRDAQGNIAAATSTTYNAASIKYQGEILNVNYRMPAEWIVRRPGFGNLEYELEVTHNDLLRTNVQGAITQLAGTIAEPRWVGRVDLRYVVGPLRLTYQAFYLPGAYAAQGATPLNSAYPNINSNLRQSVSMLYSFGKRYELRAGITDLADTQTSYPSLTYGDILGRRYFVGVKARF